MFIKPLTTNYLAPDMSFARGFTQSAGFQAKYGGSMMRISLHDDHLSREGVAESEAKVAAASLLIHI
jgi:hypothetical protein